MPTQNTTPAPPPTWYGTIRGYFTDDDITHMRAHGIDLATYDDVKNNAGSIYGQVAAGNMPPPPKYKPWSTEWVSSFLAWMSAGYPKGQPVAGDGAAKVAALQKSHANVRVRKDINSLSPTELDNLKKAFTGILKKDITDPSSYFVQAGYHWLPGPGYCQHHIPGYNPWHRAFLLSFENALRSVPGCENITLPYWDITTPFPDVLKSAPFDSYTLPQDIGGGYSKGYITTRFGYATIESNLNTTYDVPQLIKNALAATDWEDFHGVWSGATYDTIIAAHDAGHNSIGLTMQDPSVAAFDPVFWFFHANWDRLYWTWQTHMKATDLNGLLSTINTQTDQQSYQIFTVPVLEALNPFTTNPPKLTTIDTINSLVNLEVNYEDSRAAQVVAMASKTKRTVLASEKFNVHADRVNVHVDGVNRLKIPGSFNVHLLKDGKVIASRAFFQPNEVEKCPTCVQNPVVHFDFKLPIEAVSGGKLGVWVEPLNQSVVGDHFPNKLMGNPTVDVRLLLSTE